jgi:hypothetical protein
VREYHVGGAGCLNRDARVMRNARTRPQCEFQAAAEVEPTSGQEFEIDRVRDSDATRDVRMKVISAVERG